MKLLTRSTTVAALAALSLLAPLTSTAQAQRGDQERDRADERAREARQDNRQSRRAQEARQDNRQSQRAQEARQDRRAEDARPGRGRATEATWRPRAERRLGAAMRENRSGPELSNAVTQEIGVHKGRLARIRQLRALYQEQGNAERIRRLDELRQTELQRYNRLMSAARGRLDAREIRRIESAGGPLPTAEVENVERNQ